MYGFEPHYMTCETILLVRYTVGARVRFQERYIIQQKFILLSSNLTAKMEHESIESFMTHSV